MTFLSGLVRKLLFVSVSYILIFSLHLSAGRFLYLEDLPDGKSYVIAMHPMNSSGDVYHALTYIILSKECKKEVPPIFLTYDSQERLETNESNMNTFSQIERSLAFIQQLGYKANVSKLKIDTGSCQRDNYRESILKKTLKERGFTHYLDQKALTTLIAYHISQHGIKNTTATIRSGFNLEGLSKRLGPVVHGALEGRVADEILKMKTFMSTKPLVVFHLRYSSHANDSQNIREDIFLRLKAFLESKNFCVWFICADGRAKGTSFKTIKDSRTNPFPFKIEGKDYGKMLHLLLLARLREDSDIYQKIAGIIGNTSGTLDLAAFLGHRVYDLHHLSGELDYQGVRILMQSTFLTVEFLDQEKLVDDLRTKDGKIGSFSEAIQESHLPHLMNWIARRDISPSKKVPEEKALEKAGFSSLFYVTDLANDRLTKKIEEPVYSWAIEYPASAAALAAES